MRAWGDNVTMPWAAFGISRAEFPMVAQAILLGGHVRIGLEDNLYLGKGQLATNGDLLRKAVVITEASARVSLILQKQANA